MCVNYFSLVCSVRRTNSHSFDVSIIECICNYTYIKRIFCRIHKTYFLFSVNFSKEKDRIYQN